MPLLTIPLIGRRDDYSPGYDDRVRLCLQSFVEVFKDIDVELLLVDYNQVKNKPLAELFPHPKIKNVVVHKKDVRNKIRRHFKNGVRIIGADGADVKFDDFFRVFSFPPGWAINEGLKLATGEYFVFTTTDVIVCKENLNSLLNLLRPKVMFKCSPLVASQEYVSQNLVSIIESTSNHSLTFNRNYKTKYKVGNGLFCIIDTQSARDIGGSLPYLVHRSKGADFFASFISSALGHESCVPDYRVVEIDHPKTKSTIPLWNYVRYRNGVKVFDHDTDYHYVGEWVKSNHADKTEFDSVKLPHFFRLNADKDEANRFISAFKDCY